MWFCQSLNQVEPLLVVAALLTAFSPSIYQVTIGEERQFTSPLSRIMAALVIPISLLGAISAISYGWFGDGGYLATISLICVSVALLLLFLVIVYTQIEYRVVRIRDRVFLSQFNKTWEKDLKDLESGEENK